MSGAAMNPHSPGGRPSDDDDSDDFFTGLVASNPPKRRRSLIMPVSLIGHAIAITLLFLVPILWPGPPPDEQDRIIGLIYNPPPPPPPPLPKGSAMVEKQQPAKPVTPDPTPEKTPEFTAKIEPEKPVEPENRAPDTEQVGSATGSDFGVAEGMEEGVEGGVVGGTPGGVIGGVIGGTGDGPVLDYDQPPRAIKLTKPIYPQEAFVKKIEGVVEVEFLIDSTGRVVSVRVLHSVPQLDAAAIQTVKQWIFSPAIKGGRPVSTVARAPVTFRIY